MTQSIDWPNFMIGVCVGVTIMTIILRFKGE